MTAQSDSPSVKIKDAACNIHYYEIKFKKKTLIQF